MNRIVQTLAVLGALAVLAVPAVSFAGHERHEREHHHPQPKPHRTSVPEFDPAAAGAIAAVIAGGGLVFARRRTPKA